MEEKKKNSKLAYIICLILIVVVVVILLINPNVRKEKETTVGKQNAEDIFKQDTSEPTLSEKDTFVSASPIEAVTPDTDTTIEGTEEYIPVIEHTVSLSDEDIRSKYDKEVNGHNPYKEGYVIIGGDVWTLEELIEYEIELPDETYNIWEDGEEEYLLTHPINVYQSPTTYYDRKIMDDIGDKDTGWLFANQIISTPEDKLIPFLYEDCGYTEDVYMVYMQTYTDSIRSYYCAIYYLLDEEGYNRWIETEDKEQLEADGKVVTIYMGLMGTYEREYKIFDSYSDCIKGITPYLEKGYK